MEVLRLYSYTYDKATGGLLLNSTPTGFSKEPRPVYAPELDLFGFDRFWKYDKQTDRPYMWAEANVYWYRGRRVASLKGGNVYTAPQVLLSYDCREYREKPNGKPIGKQIFDDPAKGPEFKDGKGNVFKQVLPETRGRRLRPIDIGAMVEANRALLEIMERTTVKKILAVYTKHKDKLNCFHVAFSGGKDSCVLLDLVKKALPKGSFIVVFGDTGMEFPDTYDLVDIVEAQCREEGIAFYRAKSHLDPMDSWKIFGPPSRVLRWCCSVHKTAPQTLKLREITGRNNYTGLAFVGVRAHESATRAGYEEENYSKKEKGQHSHHAILEWTAAEIWLYIYTYMLPINIAYKLGNSRAGCIFCPMSVNKADYIKTKAYKNEIREYIDIVQKANARSFSDNSYLSEGGWVSRRSGRDLNDNSMKYSEKNIGNYLVVEISNPRSEWREWIKTIENWYDFVPCIRETDNLVAFEISIFYINAFPMIGKILKQIFRKVAYCVNCGVCEASCSSGSLESKNKFSILNCTHCHNCHSVQKGCLVYNSRRIPKEEKSMSINSYDTTLPKSDWFERYFEHRDSFWDTHGLGPNQVKSFKNILRHSGLLINNKFSDFGDLIFQLGWETTSAWGLIMINLAATSPQFQWYIKYFDIGRQYEKLIVLSMLSEHNNSKNVVTNVYRAFEKLIELPLGTKLNWGHVTEDGSLIRTKCSITDHRVVLYGLFKFAEKCGDYKEFTLSTLLNDSIERDGLSPTRIFGLDREDMVPILLGLSARCPDFINASFTHGLEKITLAEDKTSQDVLNLFMGER